MDKVPWGQIFRLLKQAFTWYKKNKKQGQQQGQASQGGYGGQQQAQPQQYQNQNQNQSYPQQNQQAYHPPQQQQGHQQAYHPPQQQQNHQQNVNTDLLNSQNEQYVGLRNKAIGEGNLMAEASKGSQNAFQRGDGEAAKELSVESKEHRRLKDMYNDQAANWIYNQNNKIQPPGSVDLHGLYVQESIEFAEKAIQEAKSKGQPTIRLIVGKGNHSPDHLAKLKPAIMDLMAKEHLSAHLENGNDGVLVVQLQGQVPMNGSRGIGGKEGEESCVVM